MLLLINSKLKLLSLSKYIPHTHTLHNAPLFSMHQMIIHTFFHSFIILICWTLYTTLYSYVIIIYNKLLYRFFYTFIFYLVDVFLLPKMTQELITIIISPFFYVFLLLIFAECMSSLLLLLLLLIMTNNWWTIMITHQ